MGRRIDMEGLVVLIVDDEPQICGLLSSLVEAEGGTAVVAGSGEEALCRLRECKPDVAIVDLIMPGLSGVRVIQSIRRLSSPPKVLALTGACNKELLKKAEETGADMLMKKPFMIRSILEAIAGLASVSRKPTKGRSRQQKGGAVADTGTE